ncbi:uncharacterized protein RAG0_09551 [Rhynchosporium agropyri]|uniref:Uncharacterized protein n=1 Tax=Rhynchosporium agropyri TaxID=914238 RepID=A0A1E1KVZ2_9HELO|nr:uncharacterized protein RAG0_09551 [Rhynchosporium agropyri]
MSSMSSDVMSGGKLVILACSVVPPKGALALEEEEEEVDKVALVPEVLELSIENVNEAGSENTSLDEFQ